MCLLHWWQRIVKSDLLGAKTKVINNWNTMWSQMFFTKKQWILPKNFHLKNKQALSEEEVMWSCAFYQTGSIFLSQWKCSCRQARVNQNGPGSWPPSVTERKRSQYGLWAWPNWTEGLGRLPTSGAKFEPVPVLVNKAILEYVHVHSFTYCLWLPAWYHCRTE